MFEIDYEEVLPPSTCLEAMTILFGNFFCRSGDRDAGHLANFLIVTPTNIPIVLNLNLTDLPRLSRLQPCRVCGSIKETL